MKVPARFHVTIRGCKSDVGAREFVHEDLARRLMQLFAYEGEIPDDFFRPWRLAVHVEEDMDQGDD